ncbi:hypothetical protein BKA66DRAFT_28238 [Pyrenochaeta sp. MPI-SDFR-AT-0127]|nr:hypothetical protein BKA66DRAFT_28238 [Pyrenochaeta sp. MPI-SDFR-AT-0127]
MSSSSTNANTASTSPRFSTSTAPPPYTSSDAYSVASGKSTSKSILNKVFHRKSSEVASTGTSSRKVKTLQEIHENEAKHAARAAYFANN